MTYAEALAWLYSLQQFGIRLGLENIARLVEGLGLSLKESQYLHVAGTNGKGSVCAMMEAICRDTGYRTGLFTSPHLVSFRERVQVSGEQISEADAAAGLSDIRAIVEMWEAPPTFFEVVTALALAHFQKSGVEIAVLETGLGGRLDATNIVTPRVSVITAIALDHQQWLGNSLAEIAFEKAGIIKDGVPVVSAPQHEEVQCVLTQLASHREAPYHLVMTPLANVALGLPGSHQQWNAALAVHALEVAEVPVRAEAIASGLGAVEWPGRFQVIDERVVLDGAHNPAAAQRLAATWREVYGDEQATLIFAAMRDKDVRGICQALAPLAAQVRVVQVANDRTMTPEELCAIWQEVAPGVPCEAAASVEEALACEGIILVAGSLFLVGEVLRLCWGGGDGWPTRQ